MKTLLFFSILLSFSSFAATKIDLKCTPTKDKSYLGAQKYIVLRDALGDVQIEGLDASVEGVTEQNGMRIIGASNECDNNFGLAFSRSSVEGLVQGKNKNVTLLVTYAIANDQDDETEKSTSMNCRLLK